MRRVGVALWMVAGVAAWLVARGMRAARGKGWLSELGIALASSTLLGLVATALDFGGWREAEWRAGVFAFCGALAALGVYRLVTIFRRRALQ